jgi:hypothetical protein
MGTHKGEGPYHNNADKERVREMDPERTRHKSVKDAVSYADNIDENSSQAGKIIRKR